jgi:hypothetical protein
MCDFIAVHFKSGHVGFLWLKALHLPTSDLAVPGEVKAEDVREVAGYKRLDGWDCGGHLFR